MAASASLEEKFNAAVKAIQRLPSDGKIFSESINLHENYMKVLFNHRMK